MNRRGLILVGTLIVAALVLCYVAVIRMLVQQWSVSDTYSFGVAVPFISGYLVWLRRDRLSRLSLQPSYVAGSIFLAAAGTVLLVGRFSGILALQELSLVVMIAALVLFLFGQSVLRTTWFPLAYLLFMLPVWDIVTDRVQLPFQMFSAWMGISFLHAFGIPAFRDQTYLYLPNITLEVARACSGVNYLIAVFAVGVPQAYSFLGGWTPRIAALAFATVVAILSNGFRVALIGMFAYHHISKNIHGPGHVFQGLFVSVIGFVAISGGVGMLARHWPRRASAVDLGAKGNASPPFRSRRMLVAGVAATIFLIALASLHSELRVTPLGPDRDLTPVISPQWSLVDDAVPARFITTAIGYRSTGRSYRAPTGERVELFVVRFAYTDPVNGLGFRSVDLPRAADPVTLHLSGADALQVNRATFRDSDRQVEVAFWYDLGGRTTTERALAKVYTGLRLLVGKGPDVKLVLLSTSAQRRDGLRPDALEVFARDWLKR